MLFHNMNIIDKLRQLMTLDTGMNTAEIELRFEQIAKMLFESFAIQKGEKKYLFKEIEFYFYNKNHRDIITHPRVSKPLYWYVNDFGGIDLNFISSIKRVNRVNSKGKNVMKYVLDDSAYFGGILIRQLIEKESGEILKGPLACADLFRNYEATGCSMNKDLPILVELYNGMGGDICPKSRVNLLSSKQNEVGKVNNIFYQYHDNVQPSKETLYQEFLTFKDKLYGYEKR